MSCAICAIRIRRRGSSAVQLLREAKYPEAIAPMAPLVNDPIDEIQLEAIATELSFFIGEDVPARRSGRVRRRAAEAGAWPPRRSTWVRWPSWPRPRAARTGRRA